MSVKAGTPMMVAREKYHAMRSAETAKAFADAALVEKDMGSAPRAAVLFAVSGELSAAQFEDDAKRCRAESDAEIARYVKSRTGR